MIQDAPATMWKLDIGKEKSQVSRWLTGLGINQPRLEQEECGLLDYGLPDDIFTHRKTYILSVFNVGGLARV